MRGSRSNGTLHPQHAISINGTVVVPSGLAARKSAKILKSASRDRLLLHRLLKFSVRRKVGFLIIAVASAAILCSLFTVRKDRYAPDGIETTLRFADDVHQHSEQNARRNHNENHLPFTRQLQRSDNLPHPCENFSIPPSIVDRRRPGPRPCPVCYVPIELALSLMPSVPSESPVLKNLKFISEEKLAVNESNAGSIFGGYPSLQQRNESFEIKETMTVHCGFVKGRRPGQDTGFDINESDLHEMEQCDGLVVVSAIFGNYDVIQQPRNISMFSRRNVCFYMFIDEKTEAYVQNSSTVDRSNKVGLWKLVVVSDLPYMDPRRNGKIPKLLLHRLFPRARFSIWIDAKLELVVDPYLLLERFLWRKNVTFAISRHYKRFDVFEEAEANKIAGKYDNSSIDHQIEFYKQEGLTHYSLAKLPITSDVPEGCVIIREHIPVTNLFTCLWFNEVDRFTSRDQISFSTVRDKIMSRVHWAPDMFLDCERRNFVHQIYHRDLLEQRIALSNQPPPPPCASNNVRIKPASPSTPLKRRRDRKSGPRKHRFRPAKDNDTF